MKWLFGITGAWAMCASWFVDSVSHRMDLLAIMWICAGFALVLHKLERLP